MMLVKETGDERPDANVYADLDQPRRAGTAGDFVEPPLDDLPAQSPPASHHGGDRDYAEEPRQPWENWSLLVIRQEIAAAATPLRQVATALSRAADDLQLGEPPQIDSDQLADLVDTSLATL